MNLYLEEEEKIQALNNAIILLKDYGKLLASAERDYKIKLNIECLRLRNEGLAVTLIDKIIYGVPEVAELRQRRDIALTEYDTQKEVVNSLKLQIRIIEEQIKREYSKA